MYNMTVAQIRTMSETVKLLDRDEKVRVSERYQSGTVVMYHGEYRVTIYSNGNWKAELRSTNEKISEGEYCDTQP